MSICINMQKIWLFQWLVLEKWLIYTIWLAENILAHITDAKTFLNRVLYRNTARNIIFHYRANSVKTNYQFFQKIQKTLFWVHFWSIFPIFGAKTSYGFLAPCQNLEKTNDIMPRKCPDRDTNGRTGRSYFIGSISNSSLLSQRPPS